MLIKRLFLSACLVLLAACSSGSPEPETPEFAPTTIYLVRHAEKASDQADPVLTEAGLVRAANLAGIVATEKPMRVHSTDFMRTRQTAAPAADVLETEIEIYDARDLGAFAETLKREGGRHLVVGHSDTTPELVEALGGDPESEIDEAVEYNRLYVVEIDPSGYVSSELRRYGAPP